MSEDADQDDTGKLQWVVPHKVITEVLERWGCPFPYSATRQIVERLNEAGFMITSEN